MIKRIACCLALTLFVCLPVRANLQQELRLLTDNLLLDSGGHLPSGGKIHQTAFVADFYARGDYQPTWSDRDQVTRVLQTLGLAGDDGLNPEDYHFGALQALWDEQNTAWEDRDRRRARFDVMLTDGVILYIRHLLQGKADPRHLDPSFNFKRLDFDPMKIGPQLRRAVADNSILEVMEKARPEGDFYRQMKAALAHYRALDQRSVFRTLAAEPVLKPGQRHSHVAAVRSRLAELGYLDPASSGGSLYDPAMAAAMASFQRDHGIDVDSVIGRQSYAFLNMSWAQRVDSLRVNMDRLRWISQEAADDTIVVNIAGFELYYFRHDKLLWETPVMTGTIEHQTPVFTERLRYLEFNPTWTVPRSIIGRSLLPKFKANPQYAVDNQYRLYDRSGKEVDPLQMNWSAYSAAHFPYSVVQQPWENNALGRVKFIFPNRYAIYLHDTPSRALFARSSRAFSSGCVRVKNPLEFAEVLLDDPENWSLQQVSDLVDSREPQRRIYLNRDVDVMLMYWTTSPTREGKLQFHADVYGKDAAALAALNAPPRGM